jgi:membrane fusion protein, heavy metal efflux system
LLIVGGIALFVTGIFGIGSLLSRFAIARSNAESEETQAATPPGTFRPTDAQWENLKIVPVQLTSFQTEHTTEGKIANDDDATTPVFSPYSGRVTKLFAGAGDSVKQGSPLLAVVASEFVQGQDDLISAVATLNTARAQLDRSARRWRIRTAP